MKKISLTLFLCLCTSVRPSDCLTLATDAESLAMPSSEMVFQIGGTTQTDASQKIPFVTLSKEHALLIPLFAKMGELDGGSFPLSKLSLETWRIIERQLDSFAKLLKGDTAEQEPMLRYFESLSVEELIDLACAADFLEMEELEALSLRALQSRQLSVEQLRLLPVDQRYDLLRVKAVSKLGPLELKETVKIESGVSQLEGSQCILAGSHVVAVSLDYTIGIWDTHGDQVAIGIGHEGKIRMIRFMGGSKLASCSDDGTIRVWNMEGNQLACSKASGDAVETIALREDGKIVAGDRHGFTVWEFNGTELQKVSDGTSDSSVDVAKEENLFSFVKVQDSVVSILDRWGNILASVTNPAWQEEGSVYVLGMTGNGMLHLATKHGLLTAHDYSFLRKFEYLDVEQIEELWQKLSEWSPENQEQKKHYWEEVFQIVDGTLPCKINETIYRMPRKYMELCAHLTSLLNATEEETSLPLEIESNAWLFIERTLPVLYSATHNDAKQSLTNL